MDLLLTNGYPYPYPSGLDDKQMDAIAEDAANHRLLLPGVVHFQMLHEVTVQFKDWTAYNYARKATGWEPFVSEGLILTAKYSHDDGYNLVPALVAGDWAYCGFILK